MNWVFLGMRPKTLIAGVIPPILAYSYYLSQNNNSQWVLFVLTLLLAIFIQIATNFYNDAIDFKKGADEERVGPERVTTQHNINFKNVMWAGHLSLFLALAVGIPLVFEGGIVLAILGVISLFLAYGYTGGPFPLAYLGLGEIFVFLFFGLVATCGSFFIYSKTLDMNIILIGSQIGLLSCTLIAINNFRDRKTDVKVGKRTLATRFNENNYLILIDIFLFVPYLIVLYFTVFFDLRAFFPLFAIPLAYKIRQGLREIRDDSECNQYLVLSAKHLLLFGILFGVFLLWR